MEIKLTKELALKKINPIDIKDLWLIQQLNNDEVILNYLEDFNHIFIDSSYLDSDSLFTAPYSILHNGDPVGFVEVFELFRIKKMAHLSYAILESERGKGYAKTVLSTFSDILLCEARKLELLISDSNKGSKRVALDSGFCLQNQQYGDVGFKIYEKVKSNK